MAGNYPDAPGPRMAIDLDGTQVYLIDNNTGNVTQATQAQLTALNDETDTPNGAAPTFGLGTSSNGSILVVFPEKRDVVGYFGSIGSHWGMSGQLNVYTSVDTTNGIDGTWTAGGTTNWQNTAIKPGYRSPQTVTWNAIKAIRFGPKQQGGLDDVLVDAIHIYGTRTAGENPDRLVMWHPTLDQRLGGADLDWGNAPRSSSADKTFRVKNLSATKTATTITLSVDCLSDTTPSVAAQHLLSTNGSSFTATASIASLAPGVISNVVTVRRNTPVDAVLSLWTARVKASATSWA